jgi:hypothetical protein
MEAWRPSQRWPVQPWRAPVPRSRGRPQIDTISRRRPSGRPPADRPAMPIRPSLRCPVEGSGPSQPPAAYINTVFTAPTERTPLYLQGLRASTSSWRRQNLRRFAEPGPKRRKMQSLLFHHRPKSMTIDCFPPPWNLLNSVAVREIEHAKKTLFLQGAFECKDGLG